MGHARLTKRNYYKEWPKFLQKTADNTLLQIKLEHPILIKMDKDNAAQLLEELTKERLILEVIDNYDEQLAELFLSRDAHLYRANETVQINSIKELLKAHYQTTEPWRLGTWVYYPWSGQLVHVIAEDLFNDLRTIRNRDLITKEEQGILANFRVACLGMSVGSSGALATVISGISNKIKLVDGAVISGSNLNRIVTGIASIGQEKSLVMAKELYEMNPYISVHRLSGKLTPRNLTELFERPWKISLVVDEIDDLEMKIRVRQEARKRKIPVIMATELADNVMLDVERFDLEPGRPLFHNLVKGIERIVDKKNIPQREWMKYATTIIGTKNIPLVMQESLLKIGTKIVTHPQLGATAMMTGGVIAFIIKKIALGKDVPSMRTNISLEKLLKEHRSFKYRRLHTRHTKIVQKALNSM